jgi:hypothetical protein
MKKIVLSLVVATMAAVNTAWAVDYPKPYESTYETTIEGYGTQQIHYLSDGKGHMRTETTDPKGELSYVLMDYPQHTLITTTIISGQKRFMKSPLPDYAGPAPYKQDAKELGAKVIDDHACHGYENTAKNGQVTRLWVDDKTDCTILTEGLGPGPLMTTKMKSWVGTAPTFSMDLPSGYTQFP